MASDVTRLSDLVIPEVFDNYVNDEVATKLNILNSSAVSIDASFNSFLAGAGNSFTTPMWLDNTDGDGNVASDDPTQILETRKVTATSIIVPRMVRTNGWSASNLDNILIAEDPVAEMIRQESIYRQKQIQNQVLKSVAGIFANNALAKDAYHEQNDMILDLSTANSGAYSAGVTNFTAECLIDAISDMGDSQDELGLIFVHPRVYAQMKKQQLIETIQPATVGALPIYMYGGYRVITNSLLPHEENDTVFTTYIFGSDQIRMGLGSVASPISFHRDEKAGNGMGVTEVITRYQNAIGINGFSFVANVTGGGPDSSATAGNLANANSWRRVTGDRRNVKMVALKTREA